MSEDRKLCEDRFAFFLQELPPEETLRYEQHLTHCPECREELAELQQAWAAIPFEMEEVELPESLRDQVMGAILPPKPMLDAVEEPKRRSVFSRWTYAAAALLLFLAGGATVWSLSRQAASHAPKLAIDERLNVPMQPVSQVSLKAFDQSMPGASGNGMVMQQGDGAALMLHVSGLKPTEGAQAYQVWLVKDGKRKNCGTFRVDAQGNGGIMYELTPAESKFDAIGITLEPDSEGNAPRGKKVLGT
ncbi:anti-sigma factor [Paenibacillus cremeus]|uniref:Anti-sigma-W factor RsiW n=1 Tax=Paenibacillus cremeus TaxID=2163881 RepID=A0A559KBL8_9BACL|nr:anti-sigma factor [Paenibacillus cremeus]TVY09532.1 hypothetical protein FPZ49_12355 [Paenibacillus cremeus]